MTYEEYRAQIDRWSQIARDAGVKTSGGDELPITFWKTFLRLNRRVHMDIYNMKHNTSGDVNPDKVVQTYISRSIYFANLLDEGTFIKEVRDTVSVWEGDRRS
ncbi:hypothetical protein L1D14_07625 [Vibrio tubiashii]|uniref:hypothetical protein n=1 Tax=Vibrio tubiashii TaxID=29498 RepID=UPI001EFC819D|nr:hypothetical protein [Vibrio tubiashii]MCG9576108.1 hypothetical protein [Vibrio tubiashii]